MIDLNTENSVLTINFPFDKNTTSEIFDIIKTININVCDNKHVDKYVTNSNRHIMDKIIDNIVDGINNYSNQIKINLCIIISFGDYKLFRYFVKFADRLKISPSILLDIRTNVHASYIKKILDDFNVTKLVLHHFKSHTIDSFMDINYDNILKLVLRSSDNSFKLHEIIVFLNKFKNLKSIDTKGIFFDSDTHEQLEVAVFNLEKIKTDDDKIFFLYRHKRTT